MDSSPTHLYVLETFSAGYVINKQQCCNKNEKDSLHSYHNNRIKLYLLSISFCNSMWLINLHEHIFCMNYFLLMLLLISLHIIY